MGKHCDTFPKFKSWLDNVGLSPLAFSRAAKISHVTVYRIYNGMPLKRKRIAAKIARLSNGKLTPKDLGIGI